MAERRFFRDSENHKIQNLELIERSMQLASQRRKQFAALWEQNPDDQLDAVYNCLVNGLPIVPVNLELMSPGAQEAYACCMITIRLTSLSRLFKSHIGVLDCTKTIPPSVCGYANLSQKPNQYVLPVPAPETVAVDSAEVSVTGVSADQLGFAGSCSIQLFFGLLFPLPRILERYFPNAFRSYVNCVNRAAQLFVAGCTKVRRIR